MDQLTIRRERDREQQRKHRESKKMNKPTVINIPFKSRQSKVRAVTKEFLKKPREVVKGLFKSLTHSLQERIRNSQNNNSTNVLSKETVNLLKAFYEDDANSRVLPGKKMSSRQGVKVTKM